MAKRIPVTICIDVEPDDRFIRVDQRSPWTGFERSERFFSSIREIFDAPRFSWFVRLDPQIQKVYGSSEWPLVRYRRLFDQIGAAGDSIGIHVHSYRWIEEKRTWIIDHANQGWIDHCVRTSFDAFRVGMGRPCTLFRFGDRWMNTPTMNLLGDLGVHFDLTVEPLLESTPSLDLNKPFSGCIPGYEQVPRRPYRPASTDFQTEDFTRRTGPWEMPVSTGVIDDPGIVRKSYYRLRGRRAEGIPLPLNLGLYPDLFEKVLESSLAHVDSIVAVVRTSALSTWRGRKRVKLNLESLVDSKNGREFIFCTAEENFSYLSGERESDSRRFERTTI